MPYYNYEKDYPFAAFITNLGKYNEGELVGEWVKFPTTAEEMKKVFERIGIGKKDDFGNPYEEWFISDYDCYVGNLYDKLGEYESLDELNYLAAKLDDMDRYEYNQFLAAMEMGDHCRDLQEIINLTENLDCYEVYSGIEDYDDLGRYYIEELDAMQVPEHLKNYIDYEAYGRDVAIDENGSFTEFGYVRDTGSSFHEYYDGERGSIPDKYRVMTFQDDLPEEEKCEWAMDIAFDLDEFFRQHDPQYAADHPDAHAAKEEIYEKLMAGRISALDEKLVALGQTENDYLPSEIEKFKDATGYEEWLDFDPAEVKAMLDDPDHSRVDDMLSFAAKAEQDYAAEAASYVQTPLDIVEQAQAVYGEPDACETGQRIQTPRGSFAVTNMSREQMEAAGYGYHHSSDDGKYLIMGNGTRAFAIVDPNAKEQANEMEGSALAAEIDQCLREYSQEYTFFFPKEDVQCRALEESIMAGQTPKIKTGLINLSCEMDIRAEVAPLVAKLDAYEKGHGIDTYMVYQLKAGDETRDLRFEPFDRLAQAGHTVDLANYELVYAAPIKPGDTLETIYRDLNMDRPENFRGHSLSVSDVVVLREQGKDTAHYCDSVGFVEVPHFLDPQPEKDNPLRTAEMTLEDDYGMIDGVINNGRRGEELEKAKEVTEKKPSIRERLADAKRECAERPKPEKQHSGRNTPEHGDL